MKTLKLIFVLFALIALPFLGVSDPPLPPPPGGGGGPGGGGTPVGAPIDGGMGILLALGLAYGGKKLYTMRKEKVEPETEE
ncbi:MAG: hypothetical protein WCK09_19275 [Bacteroidota bacterium]